jgi:hypothetical protein
MGAQGRWLGQWPGAWFGGSLAEEEDEGGSGGGVATAVRPAVVRQPVRKLTQALPEVSAVDLEEVSRLAEQQRQQAGLESQALRQELAQAVAARDALAVEIAESVIDKAKEQAKATDKRNRAALLAWMLLR